MIALLNGSPKAPGGASGAILKQIDAELGERAALFSARDREESVLKQLENCETVIIVFPIYADALPSHLLQFLMDWEKYRKTTETAPIRVYAISHAGFYDGKQCRWSLDIVRNFCTRAGLIWSGSLGMGGAVVFDEKGIPAQMLKVLREAVSLLAQTAGRGEIFAENHFVSVGMPRWMYRFAGNMGWKISAKQNGLKAKALRQRE